MKIGICGLGTVGTGTLALLKRNLGLIEQRINTNITIVQIASRRAVPGHSTNNISVSTDVFEVANNPDISLLVELIGGIDVAKQLILTAIDNGKHVVTDRKSVV